MEFSNEFLKNFSKINYNRLDRDETLKITGVNYLGQVFETVGTPMGNGYIDSEAISLFLGQYNGPNKRKYLTFFNSYRGNGSKCLYVIQIEKDGHVIYRNADYAEIIMKTSDYAKNLYAFTTELGDSAKELEDTIAKPIVVNGCDNFAVKSVQKNKNNGLYKIECTNGTFETSYLISHSSEVKLDEEAINRVSNNNQGNSEPEM